MENLFLGIPKFGHITVIMCLNIGTPNDHHFQFGTNVKVGILGVPVLTHFRIILFQCSNAFAFIL